MAKRQPRRQSTRRAGSDVTLTPEAVTAAFSITLAPAVVSWRLIGRVRGAVDAEFGEGTAEQLGADMLFAPFLDGTALDALAPRLRWRPRTRADLRALRRHVDRAEQSEAEARVSLKRAGLFLASHDMARAQRIRLGSRRGSRWIPGEVAPADLPPLEAFRWFAQAAKGATTAVLRGEEWPATGPRSNCELGEAVRIGDVLLASEAPDALSELTARETKTAYYAALARALPTLSSDERIVLYALADQKWDNGDAQRQTGIHSATYFRQVKHKALVKLRLDPTLDALFRES